jgi:hypothetical protein
MIRADERPQAGHERGGAERGGEFFQELEIEHLAPAHLRERVVHLGEKRGAHRRVRCERLVEMDGVDEDVASTRARALDAPRHARFGQTRQPRDNRKRKTAEQRRKHRNETDPAPDDAEVNARIGDEENGEKKQRERRAGDQESSGSRKAKLFRCMMEPGMDVLSGECHN